MKIKFRSGRFNVCHTAHFVWSMLFLLLWYQPGTWANDTSVDDLLDLSLEELLDYEVSAPTKNNTKLSESPGTISVITYEQIRDSGASSIPELLRLVPGVHVRWNPMVQSIEIRSFGSNPFTSEVLLLIDGIPYNSWNKGGFPQHPGFDFFNLENVKHLEVIRGAGSALYGENALNGVINIVTLSGDEYRQTRISALAGARSTRQTSISYGTKLKDVGSVFVSARAERTELPLAFWEDKKSSGEDVFIKGKIKQLELSYYRRQDDFYGFDELIVPPDFGFRSADKVAQEVNIAALKFDHKSADGKWSVKAQASYADRKGTHCGGCHAITESDAFAGSIDHGSQQVYSIQVGLHQSDMHDWLVGVESRKNSAGDAFNQVNTGHAGNEVFAYNKQAIFVQDHMTFLGERLNIVAGVRYDSETSPTLFDGEFFPRLAVVYQHNDRLTLRSSWGLAARYPSFTELYQNIRFFAAENASGQFAFPPTVFQPNPGLHIEKVNGLEMGVEYQVSKNVSAKLDLYANRIKDTIVLTYGDGYVGFENHPNDVTVKGAEFELKVKPNPRLSAFVNYSYQHNSQSGNGLDSAGRPVEFTYAPKHKLNAGVTFDVNKNIKSTLELSWRDETVAPQFWNDLVFGEGSQQTLSDYAYLNYKLRYRLPFDINRRKQPLTINLIGKNLLNERNIETLTGVDGTATGREFFIGFDFELAN